MKNKEIRPELEQMLRDIENPLFGNITTTANTSTTTGSGTTISIESIKEAVREVERAGKTSLYISPEANPKDVFSLIPPVNPASVAGLPIFTLPPHLSNMQVPVKQLKKKAWHEHRGRVRNYVRRVNKKWLKKFGTKPILGPNEMLVVDMGQLEMRVFADLANPRRTRPAKPTFLMRSDQVAKLKLK